MSNPTNETITSMTAVSGSSTHPSFSMVPGRPGSPNWNQGKLNIWTSRCWSALLKATQERNNAPSMAKIASPAEKLRCRRLARALNPAASRGSEGISQRWCTIQSISSPHRIDLIHIRCLVMPVNGDDQRQSDRRFRSSHSNGKNYKNDPFERLRIRTVTPEGDEVQIRRVQHQFNPDENENGVAPRQRSRQTDGEEERRDKEIAGQRSHIGKLQTPNSKLQRNSNHQAPTDAAL